MLAAYCEYRLGILYNSVERLTISINYIDIVIDILNNSNKSVSFYEWLKRTITSRIYQLQPVCAA